MMRTAIPIVVSVMMTACLAARAQSVRQIDGEKSTMTVRVGKTGLFSAFGHEHEIKAPIEAGSFSEDALAVELTVDARKLVVRDQDVSDKDRAEIQKTMLGPDVLDSEKFPEIRFRSSKVERSGPGQWTVTGELTLHGQMRPVTLKVKKDGERYSGAAEVKQRDFGITPVTAAGGAVKVKNEVRVEFEIVGRER